MRNIAPTLSRSHAAGFSIIELMIVISIIGVLAAIAIPAFNDLIKNNRRTVVVNELIASLSLARAEAAKRNQNVVVCATTSSNPTTCSGGENWNYGWLVASWVDAETPPDNNVDDSELGSPLIKQYVNEYGDITVTPDTLFNAAGSPDGVLIMRSFNQRSTNGTITICDSRGAKRARGVVIVGSGRARTVINNIEAPTGGTALGC